MLWKSERELEPTVYAVADCDGSVMLEYGVLDYCQSEACSSQFSRSAFVYAIEAVEKVRKVSGFNTRTVVREAKCVEIGIF